MRNVPNIILVDDHVIFRQGLKTIITMTQIATVIGEASNGADFIKLLAKLHPDVVIMDINMPVMDGMEATYQALNIDPSLKIIAYTMFGEQEYFNRMIGLGVKGFLLKSGGINELEEAINTVMMGMIYYVH